MIRRRLLLVLGAALVGATPAFGQVSFRGLGDLSSPPVRSWAFGISGDGTTIVGIGTAADSRSEGFLFRGGVIQGLGAPPGVESCAPSVWDSRSAALAASADGSVVVGHACNGSAAFRFEAGVMTILPSATDCPDGLDSSALSVSADGSVVVGKDCFEPVRWEDGTLIALGPLPGAPWAEGFSTDVSGNGRVIVGWGLAQSAGFLVTEAFRFENGAIVGLGSLPGFVAHQDSDVMSQAASVSRSGRVIVGTATNADGLGEAFRWERGVLVGLGEFQGPGGTYSSSAYGVSADGSRIVGGGYATFNGAISRAFLWDQALGHMEDLQTVLEERYGLDLAGWVLQVASDISADRRTIVGWGIDPSGHTQAWLAVLPPACSDRIDNDGDGRIDWDGGPSGALPDPVCVGSPMHNSERTGACGLGMELGVVLPWLMRARRRRNRRSR